MLAVDVAVDDEDVFLVGRSTSLVVVQPEGAEQARTRLDLILDKFYIVQVIFLKGKIHR